MNLKSLHKDLWEFCAVAESEEKGRYLTCMDGDAPGGRSADLMNLSTILDFMSKHQQGIYALGRKICHSVCDENDIWQITKGDLRLLVFRAPGSRLVVCGNLHLKKGQKVNKKMLAAAIAMKEQYLKAEKSGAVRFVKDLGDKK